MVSFCATRRKGVFVPRLDVDVLCPIKSFVEDTTRRGENCYLSVLVFRFGCTSDLNYRIFWHMVIWQFLPHRDEGDSTLRPCKSPT